MIKVRYCHSTLSVICFFQNNYIGFITKHQCLEIVQSKAVSHDWVIIYAESDVFMPEKPLSHTTSWQCQYSSDVVYHK